MSDTQNPSFLVMQKYHLSKQAARDTVIRTLKLSGQSRPAKGWDTVVITWNDDQEKRPITFHELIAEAREFGIIKRIQKNVDQQDSVFQGKLEAVATPNWQQTWDVKHAGFSKAVQGPCRIARVEQELMDDILYFRVEACRHSNQHEFQLTCRAFRQYLSCCVSIVDAFINRHVLLADHDGFTSDAFEELKKTTNTEKRVRLWFAFCCEDKPTMFFASQEWNHFQEIRRKRNELLHAVDPIGLYSIREIQRYLNMVRTGIGGMLAAMRYAHNKSTLGFIERLRTAPLVDYMHITFKAGGRHEVKKISGI